MTLIEPDPGSAVEFLRNTEEMEGRTEEICSVMQV